MTDDSVAINRAWANRLDPPEHDECGICGKVCDCTFEKIKGWQDGEPCNGFIALDSPVLEKYCLNCYWPKNDHVEF